MKEKVALADCIEAVLGRGEVPSVPETVLLTPIQEPVVYDYYPKSTLLMVAEEKAPYGNSDS